MAKLYTKGTTAVDEILAGAERYNILENGGGAFKAAMQIALSTTVTQAGTAINAARINNMETGIDVVDTSLDTRAGALETRATAVEGRATSLESRATALETRNTNLETGWVDAGVTWTYTGAQTFTAPGNLTAIYTKGTRIRFVQSSVIKYGIVLSSVYTSLTTITIATNLDYTIANSAITAPFYTYIISPPGFPNWFNFAPSWLNLTIGNGTQIAKYSIVGDKLFLHINVKWAAGSPTTSIGGTDVSFTPPVSPASGAYSAYSPIGGVGLVDTGVALYMGEALLVSGAISVRAINAASTYAVWALISATIPFTWGASDELDVQCQYQI